MARLSLRNAFLAVVLTSAMALPMAANVARAQDAHTLTTALPTSPNTIDPAAVVGGDNFPLMTMMVEPLTIFDKDGKLVGLLATEWKPSDDGLTWTFKLRQGVTFQDGAPFNAAAVKFSIERMLSSETKNTRPGTLAVIASVSIVDDYTVEFKLKQAFAALPAALSQPQGGIMSPASVTAAPNSMAVITKPVGTGPYKLEEFITGDHLSMVRNDAYWGEKPFYEKQVFLAVPEASSRLALLRAGDADIVSLPSISELPALQADPDLNVIFTPTSYMIQMSMNTASESQPLMRNPAVRRALSYAIDRKTIIDKILFGAGTIPNSPLAASVFGACPAGDFSYDPEKAKTLLKESGAEGMSISLIAPNGRYLQAPMVAQAVAGYLRAVGLKATLQNPMEWATYLSAIYAKPSEAKRELGMIGFGASYADPSQALSLFEGTNIPPSGFNASYFQNTDFDKLMKDALAAPLPEDRARLYCDAQKILADQAPALWLYVQSAPLVTSRDVTGVYGVNLWFVTTYAKPAE